MDDAHTDVRFEEHHDTERYRTCRAIHEDGMLCTLEKGHSGLHHAHGTEMRDGKEKCYGGWK